MKTLPYLRIGICGGIAAGKSTVLAILESVGFRTIDADKVAHSVYKPRTRGFDVVIARFGDEIRSAESGEIDRRKLGAIVFKDAAALRELENLIYRSFAPKSRTSSTEHGRTRRSKQSISFRAD